MTGLKPYVIYYATVDVLQENILAKFQTCFRQHSSVAEGRARAARGEAYLKDAGETLTWGGVGWGRFGGWGVTWEGCERGLEV